MEQVIQIIQSRLNNLRLEYETPYMGSVAYDVLSSRISELESLLDELQNVC